ncbi:MAG: hypothetical protein MHM6MM_004312 [Cercozoa sp. M6MM]
MPGKVFSTCVLRRVLCDRNRPQTMTPMSSEEGSLNKDNNSGGRSLNINLSVEGAGGGEEDHPPASVGIKLRRIKILQSVGPTPLGDLGDSLSGFDLNNAHQTLFLGSPPLNMLRPSPHVGPRAASMSTLHLSLNEAGELADDEDAPSISKQASSGVRHALSLLEDSHAHNGSMHGIEDEDERDMDSFAQQLQLSLQLRPVRSPRHAHMIGTGGGSPPATFSLGGNTSSTRMSPMLPPRGGSDQLLSIPIRLTLQQSPSASPRLSTLLSPKSGSRSMRMRVPASHRNRKSSVLASRSVSPTSAQNSSSGTGGARSSGGTGAAATTATGGTARTTARTTAAGGGTGSNKGTPVGSAFSHRVIMTPKLGAMGSPSFRQDKTQKGTLSSPFGPVQMVPRTMFEWEHEATLTVQAPDTPELSVTLQRLKEFEEAHGGHLEALVMHDPDKDRSELVLLQDAEQMPMRMKLNGSPTSSIGSSSPVTSSPASLGGKSRHNKMEMLAMAAQTSRIQDIAHGRTPTLRATRHAGKSRGISDYSDGDDTDDDEIDQQKASVMRRRLLAEIEDDEPGGVRVSGSPVSPSFNSGVTVTGNGGPRRSQRRRDALAKKKLAQASTSGNAAARKRSAAASATRHEGLARGPPNVSCHQCKCRRDELIYCTAVKHGNSERCRKKYCFRCLKKFYEEDPVNHAEDPSRPSSEELWQELNRVGWTCPSCRNVCMCAACRRKADVDLDDVRGRREQPRAEQASLPFGTSSELKKRQAMLKEVPQHMLTQTRSGRVSLATVAALEHSQHMSHGPRGQHKRRLQIASRPGLNQRGRPVLQQRPAKRIKINTRPQPVTQQRFTTAQQVSERLQALQRVPRPERARQIASEIVYRSGLRMTNGQPNMQLIQQILTPWGDQLPTEPVALIAHQILKRGAFLANGRVDDRAVAAYVSQYADWFFREQETKLKRELDSLKQQAPAAGTAFAVLMQSNAASARQQVNVNDAEQAGAATTQQSSQQQQQQQQLLLQQQQQQQQQQKQ